MRPLCLSSRDTSFFPCLSSRLKSRALSVRDAFGGERLANPSSFCALNRTLVPDSKEKKPYRGKEEHALQRETASDLETASYLY